MYFVDFSYSLLKAKRPPSKERKTMIAKFFARSPHSFGMPRHKFIVPALQNIPFSMHLLLYKQIIYYENK